MDVETLQEVHDGPHITCKLYCGHKSSPAFQVALAESKVVSATYSYIYIVYKGEQQLLSLQQLYTVYAEK